MVLVQMTMSVDDWDLVILQYLHRLVAWTAYEEVEIWERRRRVSWGVVA